MAILPFGWPDQVYLMNFENPTGLRGPIKHQVQQQAINRGLSVWWRNREDESVGWTKTWWLMLDNKS